MHPYTLRRKPGPLFSNRHWEQCRRSFLRSVQDRSGSADSAYQYDRLLRRFFGTPDGRPTRRRPDEFTRAEVEAFINATTSAPQKHGTKPSAETRNQRRSALESFYKYAAGYTVTFRGKDVPLFRKRSPVAGIPHSKPPRPAPRAMTEAEMRAIFACIPRDTWQGLRDFALFSTYFWSARRRQEISRLRWQDLELDYIFDDGHVGVLYHFKGKGKQLEDDTAELVAPAWEALKAFLAFARKLVLDSEGTIVACFMRPVDPLFPAWSDFRRPLHRGSVTILFKRYVRTAGYGDRGFCVHSLRHTAARARRREGVDVVELKELLRHSSLETTFRYLSTLDQKSDKSAVKLYGKYGDL